MSELFKNPAETVIRINEIYESYKDLSNDELRGIGKHLRAYVTERNGSKESLDAILLETYALVKETARRFSMGEVVVMTNENDRQLAKTHDFVQIQGDLAIYSNRWMAGGAMSEWRMVHYDEQLLAGVHLHNGNAIEMKTGEGKTLVATLPVFLNALTRKGVHVMTVNDYLSRRDCELTRPLYMFHGLSVDCIEYDYKTGSSERREAYNADIVFGTNSSFAFDYLHDHLAMSTKGCVQRQHYYAIIDELDSILIDEADNPHIIAGGNYYNVGEHYHKHKPVIQEMVSLPDDGLYVVDEVVRKVRFTDAGKLWIESRCDMSGLFDQQRKSEIEDYRSLSKEEQKQIAHKLLLQNVFFQLLCAYTLYERDIDYVVIDGKVVIIDPHTGRLKPSSRWEHGLHTAVEVKENVKTELDHDSMAVISLKNYFKLYERCCGMSGTAFLVADELKQTYGLDIAIIPPHRPCVREDKPVCIYRTAMAKDKAVVEEVARLHNSRRPVLVGCLTQRRAEEIHQKLIDYGLPASLLGAKNLDKEAYYIAKAGEDKAITVSTSVAGRGTDILLSEGSRKCGGLAIVAADMFDSARIDIQLKGRAGRQGDPGTSQCYVSLEDLIMRNLPEKEQESMYEMALREPSDVLPNDVYETYVVQAQTNREAHFRTLRDDTARKDDMIAPYRKKFYEKRNSVLCSPDAAREIVEGLMSDRSLLPSLYERIESHYPVVCRLLARERSVNHVAETFDIPFSESWHLYTIRVDIGKCMSSPEYFKEEYVRQVVLGAYDKYWKRFVLHLTDNLNQREIEQLPEDFETMSADVDFIIRSRVLHSTIPVGSAFGEEEAATLVETAGGPGRQPLSQDVPCPCGSGKKYGECHGAPGIRRSRSRRI